MKKLLLIEPASRLKYQKRKFQYLENVANKHYFRRASLALGVLAGLTPPDWEVEIRREPIDQIDFDVQVDLVGITAVTHTANRGYDIADEFRKRGVKVIMGGIHPTVLTEEALLHCDSVCQGEAEPLWKDVLEDVLSGQLKKIYKCDTPFDLAGYTSPRRDLTPDFKSFIIDPGVSVEVSRGCPFNCDFCSVAIIHGRKIRYRPTESIIEEIKSIESNKLFFVDNNIIADFRRSKELFSAMVPLKKQWMGQASMNIVNDPELLKLAVDSGCTGLLIGIESVLDKGLNKYIKSPVNFEELKKSVRILKEYGIKVLAHMVFGNDFDSGATMKESLERLCQLDVASASLGIIIPYPGTKFAESLEKQGRILSKDWDYYDINHLVFRPMHQKEEDFLRDVEKLRKDYFSLKLIMSRTMKFRDLEVLGLNIAQRSHNKVHHTLMVDLDETIKN